MTEMTWTSEMCGECGEPIELVDGVWVDVTIEDGAAVSVARLCETGGVHCP